jgi:hypothetical protein
VDIINAIDMAQEKNADNLAKEISFPKADIGTDGLLHIRHFAAFCQERGIKFCPARPTSVAAFARAESAAGVPAERILAALQAIEAVHDNSALPNPVATSAVRAELRRILKPDSPRSWNKSERLLLVQLAPELQSIISRHAKLDSAAVRKAQQEVTDLRHKFESLNKEGLEDNGKEELR